MINIIVIVIITEGNRAITPDNLPITGEIRVRRGRALLGSKNPPVW